MYRMIPLFPDAQALISLTPSQMKGNYGYLAFSPPAMIKVPTKSRAMKGEFNVQDKIVALMRKGVTIPNPHAVDIGEDVRIERISGRGVVLYGGTSIQGAETLICPGVKLGYESPVTVVDCQLGPQVELRGGFFNASVFLEKANMGSGAQVREGCILEEEANGAHTVGLKQTILFPFVTLGSLINFCDCFMAGGTSRKNHSEVGSSYIHFNYTPNQDKATPSLIGDVPRGVMLNQPPIFLGGQGGLVGPARIGYGTVIAAGTVYRKDCPEGGKLLGDLGDRITEKNFHPGFYGDVARRVYNNICYIANLLALRQWYLKVRQPFFRTEELAPELYAGALDKLSSSVDERIKRFQALSEKMETSIKLGEKILKDGRGDTLMRQKRELMESWPRLKACFTEGREASVDVKGRDAFLQVLDRRIGRENTRYIEVIQGLDIAGTTIGTAWLAHIVDDIVKRCLDGLPSYRI
jgi:bifunctional UDP-N-acetylglucosamine pyrophosphorylase/glucosamine-1-phosphate N-acetyltransferase